MAFCGAVFVDEPLALVIDPHYPIEAQGTRGAFDQITHGKKTPRICRYVGQWWKTNPYHPSDRRERRADEFPETKRADYIAERRWGHHADVRDLVIPDVAS